MPDNDDSAERFALLDLKDVCKPDAKGFVDKVTPKKPPTTGPKAVFFFKCECGSSHYRHAGYVKSMVPVLRAGGDKVVAVHDYPVHVCVACRKSYCWINEQMYDVSDQIDLKAWEKAERELHQATGPGGEC